MSSIGELSVAVTCDPSELTEGMTEVRDEVEETESAFVSFAKSVADSMVSAAKAAVQATGIIAGDVVSGARGALRTITQEIIENAFHHAAMARATATSAAYFSSLWTTLRVGVGAGSWFVPWLKAVSLGLALVTADVYLYRKADEYMNGAITESILEFGNLSGAITRFRRELADTATTMEDVTGGFIAMGTEFGKFGLEVTGWGSTFRTANVVVEQGLDKTLDIVHMLNAGFRGMVDTYADWRSDAGAGAAELRKMAVDTERVIALQERQADAFGQLRAIQDGAATAAAHQAELQRIASIDSVDGINAEVTALQQRNAANIDALQKDEEGMKRVAALFLALENQRKAIESGRLKKPEKESEVDSAIARARKDLAALQVGRSEAEIAALKAAGATDEQLEALRALHAEIDGINRSKEHQKRIDQELEDIARQTLQTDKSFEEQYQNLRDEIDQLTGAASDYEIAMRKLQRQGFNQEQAETLAKMSEEKKRLEEEERKAKDKSSGTGQRLAAAAEAGSSAAFSIIANASSSRDAVADNTKKIASESVKQTGHLQKLVEEVGDFQNVSVVELPA